MAGITSAAIGVGVAGLSAYQGAQQKKRGEEALEYERQNIEKGSSPYEHIQISTLGADLMREETQRQSAMAYDVLGQAGDRAILGGVGRVVAQNNLANREAQAYLDDQAIRREYAIASDEVALRQMREQRDYENIAAANSQIQAGRQAFQGGIMGIGSGIASVGRSINSNQTDQKILEILAKEKPSYSDGVPELSDSAAINNNFINPPSVLTEEESLASYRPFMFSDYNFNANPGLTEWFKRNRRYGKGKL